MADALKERFFAAYQAMVTARFLEEKIAGLYHAGKVVGGVYSGKGQEAFSAALAVCLRPGEDIFAPLIRDQAGRVAFGEDPVDFTRTYLGSVEGPMRGRDGNIHRGRPADGMPAMISHLGAMISVVNGTLFAKRLKGTLGDSVGATAIGDGGTSTGAFHEALNLASVEKLPLVISVANNQFAYSTPNDRQFACAHIADRAASYGIPGHKVDGTDLLACLEIYDKAVSAARTGGGPQLIAGTLLRLCGHGEHDDASYVPADAPHRTDCIDVAEKQFITNAWATESEIADIRAACAETVRSAVAVALKDPKPDPAQETWQTTASAL